MENNKHKYSFPSIDMIEENHISSFSNKKIFLKIKNLPLSIKEDSIFRFFKNYIYMEKSVRFFLDKNGVFQGKAIIVFLNEEECEKAYKEKNSDILYNNKIILEYSNFYDFEDYSYSNSFYFLKNSLSDLIKPEQVPSSLIINNFPLGMPKNMIFDFFQIFNLVKIIKNISNKYLFINNYF